MTQTENGSASAVRASNLALIGIALAVILIHLLTNGRYGFHRDEFQFLSDARHLDWGFVAYPPFTPLRLTFSGRRGMDLSRLIFCVISMRGM